MNFMTEIIAFNDMIGIKQLTTGQIALWYALMNVNNKCAWQEWFTASNRVLELNSGLSRQGVLKARNILKQKNLIDIRSNGTKATAYKMISLSKSIRRSVQDSVQDKMDTLNSVQDSIQNGVQDCVQGSIQNGVQGSCTLNKQNKTKQNKTNLENIIKENSSQNNVDCNVIVDMYHDICKSYPRVRSVSDSRREAIKARQDTYSLDDFREMFEKSESSDFMKGKNNRNWSATFDWMIRDANFAKILDGNYDNKSKHKKSKKDNDSVPESENADIYRSLSFNPELYE